MKSAAIQVLAAFPVFLLGAVVVLITYQERSLHSAIELPAIANVQYIYYAGPCYEWGMVGWLLSEDISKQHGISWQQHKYFIFLSSAVRGPFLPAYLQDKMHWTEPFLSRLDNKVKLVGSTVVCGDSPSHPEGALALRNGSGPQVQWRRNPHIPFAALATDRFFSEFGAAAAILKAGFAIDSLLKR
eukprot:gene8529-8711_t